MSNVDLGRFDVLMCFDLISDCAITGLETQGSMTIAIVAAVDNPVSAAGE